MNKYLYKIKDLDIPTWVKYWFLKRSKINFDLSEILNGTSFDLIDTVNKKLHLINIFGNSEQNETPSPENPQEIYSAGDNNYINEKIINKNFYNKNQAYSRGKRLDIETGELSDASGTAWCVTDYIKVTNNNKFTLSGKIVPNTWSLRICGYNKDKQFLEGLNYNYTQEKLVVNFEEKVNYIKFGFYNLIDGQANNRDFQVELGENATTYLDHQEQLYTIPCQQPMRAIGDVKDSFVKVNGVWYERHYIRLQNLTSDLVDSVTQSSQYGVFANLKIEGKNDITNILAKSNIAIGVCFNDRLLFPDDYRIFINNTGYIALRFPAGGLSTKTAIMNYIDELNETMNPYFIYVLKAPQDLLCTQEQITALENLQKAKTYKNVTHIFSEDNISPNLEIQYYKEKGE